MQALEQWDEMQQIMVCWVANPAFDGNGIVWFCGQHTTAFGASALKVILPGWKT